MKSEPSTAWSPSRPPQPSSSPPLIQALTDYDRLLRRRFHVPAHAGSSLWPADWDVLRDPYRYDLTELDGLDVLSEPSGCILEAQEQAAQLFGCARSYFLVNGASVGLMAAMLATVRPGDKVLLPRNVHRSVLSGLILSGAEPVWFLPERLNDWGLWGAVTVSQMEAELARQPDIKALFLVSPTYEGLGSDVPAIARLCRERHVLLIVDEAHGSLWNFNDHLPESACRSACDAVIHSMHKSGGSLTQGALAHLPEGSRIDPDVFQQALNTLQTTSPSYLLMASLDAACHYLASEAGQQRIQTLLDQVTELRKSLSGGLQRLRLFEPLKPQARWLWDPCKLYFINPSESGEDWGSRLETEQQLAFESVSPYGALYLANLGLEAEDFKFFRRVLCEEDARQEAMETQPAIAIPCDPTVAVPEVVLSPRDAFFAPGVRLLPESALGRTAKETVVHCPPGIPVLMPGERIRAEHLPLLPEEGVLVVR
jgi:arginine decarboxylase